MLSLFRSSLDSWIVRGLFFLLAASFMVWGIGDVLRDHPSATTVAKVGSAEISVTDLQAAYQRRMQQLAPQLGDQPSGPERQAVARSVLQQLVTLAAVVEESHRLGLAVPDSALRQAVVAIPSFQGPNNQYDPATMRSVLADNNLTEARFVQLLREDMLRGQLMDSLTAGVRPAPVMVDDIFASEGEQRTARVVRFPLAAVPTPKPPDAQAIARWYADHPFMYKTPEYRRIQAVVLSADTIAHSIDISDTTARAWYEAHRADFATPETRSVDVITLTKPADAAALAAQWRAGASWSVMEAAANKAGESPVQLTKVTRPSLPDPALGKAVFSAAQGVVVGPVTTGFGPALLRVSAITPATTKSYAEVAASVKLRVAQEQAPTTMDKRVNHIEDLLAGGTTLNELPANLGLAAVEGTLDAQGMTQDGKPAPIPGTPAQRAAVIKAAFAARTNTPPQLLDAPGDAYFAVVVTHITPSGTRPLDQVRAKVIADITKNEMRHVQNVAAAHLLEAAAQGQTLEQSTKAAGLTLTTLPALGRNAAPPAGMPEDFVRHLFAAKPGKPFMLTTPDGFAVAEVGRVITPTPGSDPAKLAGLTAALRQGMQLDTATAVETALAAQAKPVVNGQLLDQIATP